MKNLSSKFSKLIELFRLHPFETGSPEGRSKERYRRILLNSASSVIARVAMAALSLMIVPLILGSFGKDLYGLWALITATTTWFTLFDLGMVNSLVNTVSEAFGKGQKDLAASYVGTAFFFLSLSSLALCVILIPAVNIFSLGEIFRSENVTSDVILRLIVLSAALPLILTMPFAVVKQVYAGYQKSYIGNAFSIVGSIIAILAVSTAIKVNASLPIITVLYVGIPGLMYLVNFLLLTNIEMPWLAISVNNFSIQSLTKLLKISVPILLFQLGALLVNQTQPIVLAHRANLAIVADYSVLIRLHQAVMSVILMSTIAFVPSFREANEKGDYAWVKISFYRMLKIRILLSIVFGTSLIFGGNALIKLWLGESELTYGFHIWLLIGLLMVVSTWVTAYSDLLVIMDRIWPQVVLVIMNGLSILFLSYILAPTFGIVGALIGTTAFTLLISSWLLPLLAKSFFTQTYLTENTYEKNQ